MEHAGSPAAPQGLTSAQAEAALKERGPNEIPEKRASIAKKIAKWVVTPISVMLVVASGLSFFLGRDFDGWFILALLVMNGGIGFWQESKADKAIRKLNEHLRIKVKTRRDGAWSWIDSRGLVPQDVIEVAVG